MRMEGSAAARTPAPTPMNTTAAAVPRTENEAGAATSAYAQKGTSALMSISPSRKSVSAIVPRPGGRRATRRRTPSRPPGRRRRADEPRHRRRSRRGDERERARPLEGTEQPLPGERAERERREEAGGRRAHPVRLRRQQDPRVGHDFPDEDHVDRSRRGHERDDRRPADERIAPGPLERTDQSQPHRDRPGEEARECYVLLPQAVPERRRRRRQLDRRDGRRSEAARPPGTPQRRHGAAPERGRELAGSPGGEERRRQDEEEAHRPRGDDVRERERGGRERAEDDGRGAAEEPAGAGGHVSSESIIPPVIPQQRVR